MAPALLLPSKGHPSMSLRASLLRQLENPYLSRNQRAELGCDVARQLEDVGDYAGAREAISEFWRGVGERPQVAGLNESAAAEVLLRAGTLDRKSTRLNSSHANISYAVFCLKKK